MFGQSQEQTTVDASSDRPWSGARFIDRKVIDSYNGIPPFLGREFSLLVGFQSKIRAMMKD